jgi:hypothetical protein
MSTDIVQFTATPSPNKPQKVFSLDALQLFLAITVPLMFFTFLAWGVFYWWENWRDRVKSNARDKGSSS